MDDPAALARFSQRDIQNIWPKLEGPIDIPDEYTLEKLRKWWFGYKPVPGTMYAGHFVPWDKFNFKKALTHADMTYFMVCESS